jgi:Ca-activated chloride channel homolog
LKPTEARQALCLASAIAMHIYYCLLRRAVALAMGVIAATYAASNVALHGQDEPRFRSGIDLVNVTATVTDRAGRFVSGLSQQDFVVYEDDRPVEVSLFSAERVPVSLGFVLDTSGSMAGDKIGNAFQAIDRFLDWLGPEDEVFLYSFGWDVELVQDWTTHRDEVRGRLRHLYPVGGTPMYDAMIDALPVAQTGRNRKKAIVLISDGNDMDSRNDIGDVRKRLRQTDVMVYAVGIDGSDESTRASHSRGRRRHDSQPWVLPQRPPRRGGREETLNVSALREITDASGGRTEVVRRSLDLDAATTAIADELSRQYYLGYTSPGRRDGRWRSIRVEVRDPSLRVRARDGYTAPSS